ncbi:ATP-binding protein [Helicobacter baculiformis]|uniref:ATP-binding protein n=1 Tax=Helicobacter baculiformis TaxID=427351 RepID=A0ABV7ZI55_9HELI|nr:ATP-binding protein [Helicobacter baculiformis]
MQYLIDFLQVTDIKQARIFYALKCGVEEALILQYLTKEYLKGHVEIEVLPLLETLFEVHDDQILSYLRHVKNLLELEWIIQEKRAKRQEILLLELLDGCIALSPAFLKLVEEGHSAHPFLDTSPYEDHLDYFNDWFFKIDLLRKLQRQKTPQASAHAQQQLELLEHKIKARTECTQNPLSIQKFLHKHALNPKEIILFFALLKSEYSEDYSKEEGCDFKSLLDLLSVDGSARQSNAALLSPHGALIKKNIMDFEELLDPFDRGMVRQYFLQEWVLSAITAPNPHIKGRATLKHILKDSDIFEALESKVGLDSVILSQKTKETLEILCKQMESSMQARLRAWGIKSGTRHHIQAKIIFYGPPGTGKTMSALALAKSLKKEVLCFDCSKILSMYVGESEKNVRRIFDDYYKIAKQCKNPPILFLDEADQFLSTRTTAGSGADKMHNQMQNIFLHQIEKFEGVLIATTNLLETLDTAFSRRFNHKIEFKPPTFEQRVQLWQQHLPKNAPYAPPHTLKSLAHALARHALSGGQIALVVRNTAYKVATYTQPLFTLEDFLAEIKKEKQSNFEGVKNIGFGV